MISKLISQNLGREQMMIWQDVLDVCKLYSVQILRTLYGWVFQKRWLAPRTMYSGREGIYWEYLERHKDERNLFSTNHFSHEFGYSDPKRKLCIVQKHYKLYDQDTMKRFYRAWYALIESFSSGELTYASDKLEAIAGVLEILHERAGMRSFAGLLEPLLPEDLLWWIKDPEWITTRPSSYRAPSFSWASLDGKVFSPLLKVIFLFIFF